jgi:hypothetical protein
MLIGLTPLLWATGSGADVMKRIAAPMIGGSALQRLPHPRAHPRGLHLLARARVRQRPSRRGVEGSGGDAAPRQLMLTFESPGRTLIASWPRPSASARARRRTHRAGARSRDPRVGPRPGDQQSRPGGTAKRRGTVPAPVKFLSVPLSRPDREESANSVPRALLVPGTARAVLSARTPARRSRARERANPCELSGKKTKPPRHVPGGSVN